MRQSPRSCRASAGWARATCARRPRPPTSSPKPTSMPSGSSPRPSPSAIPRALVVGEEACEIDARCCRDLARRRARLRHRSGRRHLQLRLRRAAVRRDGRRRPGWRDRRRHHPRSGRQGLSDRRARGRAAISLSADGARSAGQGARRPCRCREMTGAVSWQYRAEPERSRLARNQTKCLSQIGYRCAAHEYRLIASGHAHFALYNKMMPWDHLAGVLIHQEAGGHAARLDGSAYRSSHLGRRPADRAGQGQLGRTAARAVQRVGQ